MTAYLICWATLCVLAFTFGVHHRQSISLFSKAYIRFVCQPWKLGTFLIAATLLTVIAPYTNDPTWDYVDAIFMSILTFLSAPYAIGVLVRSFKRHHSLAEVGFALCLWLFSASWSYDLYLYLRDGNYPVTWLANLELSSVLYVLAGLLWNLEWREGLGTRFAFQTENWPRETDSSKIRKAAWIAIPIMLIAAAILVSFLR